MGNSFWKEQESIEGDYEVLELLGRGSFSAVKRCRNRQTGKEYAVKVVKKKHLDPKTLENVKGEVDILQRIDHPNVVHLEAVYDTPDKLYVVLELWALVELRGGELFDRIVKKRTFSEREAADIIRTVAGAVKYMHSLGIVHRDLKPENLVYDSKEPDATLKVTDFGLAKFMVHDSMTQTPTMKSIVGTIGYMAPEILNNELYSNQVDLWSLGVILFVLLCGYPPFYDATPAGLFGAIRKGSYVFADPYWTNISKDAKFVVFRLLTVDPSARMTINELLEHPWINNSEAVAPQHEFKRMFSLKLQMFNTRRALRRSILMVLALNRLASHICGSWNHDKLETGGESKEK